MESFETARLVLRPRTLGDFEACRAMDSDLEVIRYVGAPWSNEAEHLAFLRQRMAERFPRGLGYWTIVPKDDPASFLGWIMLCPCTVAGAEVEIGWRLPRVAWGRGYATEAAAPILAQGFRNAEMSWVVADIDPENHASLRVAEKIGLRYTGPVDYPRWPARRYSLTREAFERQRSARESASPPGC
jgi:RimJ/RimL family protein N-acetyltransferase